MRISDWSSDVCSSDLGGAALTHASDLDLIYVFTGDYAAESDGPKPHGAVHYYNRLAQRVSGALSVPHAAEPLYELDPRLPPSATQRQLPVSTDGLARYTLDIGRASYRE